MIIKQNSSELRKRIPLSVPVYFFLLISLAGLGLLYQSMIRDSRELKLTWANLEKLWDQQHNLMNQITDQSFSSGIYEVIRLKEGIQRASTYDTRWNNQESLLEYLQIEREIVALYQHVSLWGHSQETEEHLFRNLEAVNDRLYEELCSFQEVQEGLNQRWDSPHLQRAALYLGIEDYGSLEICSRDYILAGVE